MSNRKTSTIRTISLVAGMTAAILLGGVAQAQSSSSGMAGFAVSATGQGWLPGSTKLTDNIANPAPMAGTPNRASTGMSNAGNSYSGQGWLPGSTKPTDNTFNPAPMAGTPIRASSGMSSAGNSFFGQGWLPGSTKPSDNIITPVPAAGFANIVSLRSRG